MNYERKITFTYHIIRAAHCASSWPIYEQAAPIDSTVWGLRSAAQGRLRSRVQAHANVCILLAVSVASIWFQKCNLNKQILWFLCSFSIVELQVTTNGVVITANIYYLISISQCLSVVQLGLQPMVSRDCNPGVICGCHLIWALVSLS